MLSIRRAAPSPAGRRRTFSAMFASVLVPALALGGLIAASPMPMSPAMETAARALDTIPQIGSPSITGEMRVGETVIADPGVWGPAPVRLEYQWFIEGSPVTNSRSYPDYTIRPEDLGRLLQVGVKGTKTGYLSTMTFSESRTVLPGVLVPPSQPYIYGSSAVGDEAGVSWVGRWEQTSVNVNYRWCYDGEEVPNSDAPRHVIRPEGLGKTLSVKVIGSKPGYDWLTFTTFGRVIEPAKPFSTAPTPKIARLQQPAGLYFSALPGAWEPEPTSLSYQWLRAGVAIPGATAHRYTPTGADAGKSISVRVTAKLGGWKTTVRTSAALKGPVLRLTSTPRPKLSVTGGGAAKAGKRMTVKVGAWKPARVKLSYRWLRNGKAITGATKSRYTLTPKDRGKRISVRVTAKKTGYHSVSKVSSSKRVSRAR